LIGCLHPTSDLVAAPAVLALAGGFLLWLFLYFALPRPVRSYILAHELTHALWASVMGAEVLKLQVGKSAGSVSLSRSNFLITLAPYFFPLYTVMVIAGYYLLSVFFEVEGYATLWLGLVGFSWGFHLTFTITTLLQHQTDIHEYGRLFSYTVICGLNIIGVGIWTVMVSPATLEQLTGFLKVEFTRMALHVVQGLQSIIDAGGLQ